MNSISEQELSTQVSDVELLVYPQYQSYSPNSTPRSHISMVDAELSRKDKAIIKNDDWKKPGGAIILNCQSRLKLVTNKTFGIDVTYDFTTLPSKSLERNPINLLFHDYIGTISELTFWFENHNHKLNTGDLIAEWVNDMGETKYAKLGSYKTYEDAFKEDEYIRNPLSRNYDDEYSSRYRPLNEESELFAIWEKELEEDSKWIDHTLSNVYYTKQQGIISSYDVVDTFQFYELGDEIIKHPIIFDMSDFVTTNKSSSINWKSLRGTSIPLKRRVHNLTNNDESSIENNREVVVSRYGRWVMDLREVDY